MDSITFETLLSYMPEFKTEKGLKNSEINKDNNFYSNNFQLNPEQVKEKKVRLVGIKQVGRARHYFYEESK